MSKTSKGQELYRRARRRIPGGTQLLSKRPEMFLPEQWPAYYSQARGVEVWDLDGNRYIDMCYSGIGACVLGFADPEVDDAVHAAIRRGSACTLNCPEEVELAELLCELHPWADMVRYVRSGGEAMAAAVRIARAKTRRDKIVFCGYHGWHDWYLAANLGEEDSLDGHLLSGLAPAGVPRTLAGSAIPFSYNDTAAFHDAVEKAGADLAAIVMEPLRSSAPAPGFLETIREEATRRGAVLIYDEITAGLRMNTGGIHLLYPVRPDIAVFAKAMSNGYPFGAVLGTGDVMQAAQDTFLSSTHWTERVGPTAALATIGKHLRENVGAHLIEVGNLVQGVWRKAAAETGVTIDISGIPPLSRFVFRHPNPQPIRTLFTQEMLDRGYLASNAFYATFAHQPQHVAAYGDAVNESFRILRNAIETGTVLQRLRGPVAHAGFQRLA